METEPIELTNEEQAELRQLRQIIYDNADAPNLTPEQWKRLVYLQNKEYRYEKAQAVRYQNETEDKIAKLQHDNLKLADKLEQAENLRHAGARRRINFGDEEGDETFNPPRTSSRLGRRFRPLIPSDEDAVSKLQDMTRPKDKTMTKVFEKLTEGQFYKALNTHFGAWNTFLVLGTPFWCS